MAALPLGAHAQQAHASHQHADPFDSRRLLRAKQLGGEITYLRQGEIDARNRGYSPYSTETWRAWEY